MTVVRGPYNAASNSSRQPRRRERQRQRSTPPAALDDECPVGDGGQGFRRRPITSTTACLYSTRPPRSPQSQKSSAATVTGTSETAKPKHRQPSTEDRVIQELHRHRIYW